MTESVSQAVFGFLDALGEEAVQKGCVDILLQPVIRLPGKGCSVEAHLLFRFAQGAAVFQEVLGNPPRMGPGRGLGFPGHHGRLGLIEQGLGPLKSFLGIPVVLIREDGQAKGFGDLRSHSQEADLPPVGTILETSVQVGLISEHQGVFQDGHLGGGG